MPPDPRARPPQGKSVAEIHSKWARARNVAISAVPIEGTPEVDSNSARGIMDRAQDIRDQIQERRLANLTISQVESEMELQNSEIDARKAEAEAKTLESKTKIAILRQKAEESAGSGGDGGNALVMAALFDMLEKSNERLADASARGNQQPAENMNDEAIKMLVAQLAEIRAEMRKPTDSVNPLEKATNDFQLMLGMKQLFDELRPQATAAVASSADHDLTITIEMEKIKMQHEARMLEIELQRERMREDIRMKEREITAEENRSKTLAQSFASIAEVAKPLIAELAQMATNRQVAATPIAAYSVPEQMSYPVPAAIAMNSNGHEEPIQAIYSPQTETSNCPRCGNPVEVAAGTKQLDCPSCGLDISVEE